jgi:hypothetical protein
MVRGRETE